MATAVIQYNLLNKINMKYSTGLNSRNADWGICVDSKKKMFRFADAQEVANRHRRRSGTNHGEYRCNECGYWHVGSTARPLPDPVVANEQELRSISHLFDDERDALRLSARANAKLAQGQRRPSGARKSAVPNGTTQYPRRQAA